MYVNVLFNGVQNQIADPKLSKLTTVSEFRKMVRDKTKVDPAKQRLFFRGKQLEDGYTLFDYNCDRNSIIYLMERVALPEDQATLKNEHEQDKEKDENEAENGQCSAPTEDGPSTSAAEIKIEDIYHGNPDDLKEEAEPPCKKCKNDPDKDCNECGCVECKKKDHPEVTLMCDQCEYYYHTYCLDPPLEKVPDDDWYCPQCKNDPDEVVLPGAKLKYSRKKANMPSMVRNLGSSTSFPMMTWFAEKQVQSRLGQGHGHHWSEQVLHQSAKQSLWSHPRCGGGHVLEVSDSDL